MPESNLKQIHELDPRLKNVRLRLLSNGIIDSEQDRELHDRSFQFWKQFWQTEFTKIDPAYRVREDDFYRQTRIMVMTHESEIVAMHLYQLFDLRLQAALSHSYISGSFNAEYLDALTARKIKRVMSMEYLTVNEDWRSKSLGVPLAYVIGEIVVKVARSLGVQAAIAPARSDYKVSTVCEDIGGSTVVRDVEFHNVKCDLILLPTETFRPSSRRHVHQVAENLWQGWLAENGEDNEMMDYPQAG